MKEKSDHTSHCVIKTLTHWLKLNYSKVNLPLITCVQHTPGPKKNTPFHHKYFINYLSILLNLNYMRECF